jgi:hypothetical protein
MAKSFRPTIVSWTAIVRMAGTIIASFAMFELLATIAIVITSAALVVLVVTVGKIVLFVHQKRPISLQHGSDSSGNFFGSGLAVLQTVLDQ